MPSNALDYITVRGFKSIDSIEKLPLRPINVLIGSNGSGKSNFIGVFSFLHAVREGRLRKYVIQAGGAEKVLHFGSKTTKQIEARLFFGGEDKLQYHLVLAPTNDDGLYPTTEVASAWTSRPAERAFDVPLLPREQGREAGIGGPPRDAVSGPVRARLGGWKLYHLHDTSQSSPMRKTTKVNDNESLRSDGSNLAAFLYLLQERHPTSYTLIRRTIQQVAPFFDDFRLAPKQLNPDDIMLEWKHQNSEQYFDSGSLSDGTLRFIALATLFLQPKEFLPSIILVDEPELGLHPYAIEMLASLIRQASTSTQVIVSTQSSLLLDHFDPEDVLVANRVEGGTQIARLEPSRLKQWLEDYSLGQLWEKNELTGRPLSE